MLKKLLQAVTLLAILIAPFSVSLVHVAAAPAHESCASNNVADNIATGANSTAEGGSVNCDASDTKVSEGSLTKIASKIVNLISLIVGIAAVIMIIVGGFKYITSGGDSNRVGSAKNTILFALIGLVIVALAQLIVKFVLNQTTSATGT